MKKKNDEIKRVYCNNTREIDGELICKIEIAPEKYYFYKEEKVETKDVLFQIVKEEYEIMGVWALFGKAHEGWECLQVAQKANMNLKNESIGCEIVDDLQLIFNRETEECSGCKNSKEEDRAFYKQVYRRHLCECCQKKDNQERLLFQKRYHARKNFKRKDKITNLARRYDMYHKIAEDYNELLFYCIYKLNNNNCIKEERQVILNKEKEYAKKYQAIYFR